jgi:hypothetical protein
LPFQFDILDIEGKDDGADLLVCAVCVFGIFGGERERAACEPSGASLWSPAVPCCGRRTADSSPKKRVRNDKGWDGA